jgi:hypothetical protein
MLFLMVFVFGILLMEIRSFCMNMKLLYALLDLGSEKRSVNAHLKEKKMLRRIMTITLLSTALAFCALFPLNNQAHAASHSTSYPSQTASTTGAVATCSLTTSADRIHDDTAQIECDLKDTKADGDAVYVEWWQDGFEHTQLRNSLGNGHTIYVVDTNINGAGSFETAYFKVCRDISFWPDDCSSTMSWSPLH